MHINIGSKYYQYDNDKRLVFRAKTVYDEEKGLVFIKDDETGIESLAQEEKLLKRTIELAPDGKLDIMITAFENGDLDIYAWVYRSDFIAAGKTEPILILKQDGYSNSKNAFASDGNIWIGDCVSYKTNPLACSLLDYADFDHVVSSYTISIYLTDKLSDILECISDEMKKALEDALASIRKRYESDPAIRGVSQDLEHLFTDNRFMEEFRGAFNIQTIDWPIDLGPESHSENGDIILNEKQVNRLQDELQKYITDIQVLSYDRDIDIKNIVKYDHIVVCDSDEKIYLIAYRVLSLYPVDDDISRGMGLR